MAVSLEERPIRFDAAWLSHREFMKFTKKNWKMGRLLKEASKEFTNLLRMWNKEVFEDIKKRKERLRKRLGSVQKS